MKLPEKITNIMAHIISHGYKTRVIGGATRDYFKNITPHDYDIFTNAKGEELLQLFPDGHVIGGEERQEKILTVMVDGVEVSTFRRNGKRTEIGATLEEHQATCDFTMNSIACDINGYIDLDNKYNAQGVADIKANKLRFVGDALERIDEDENRITRGIRFLLAYNMKCDKKTLILLMAHKVSVPKERIREELIKIFSLNLSSGFLKYILRFMPKEMAHPNNLLSGGKWHKETPYTHFESSCLEVSKVTSDPLLRMCASLHDVGKSTKRITTEHCPFCNSISIETPKTNKCDCTSCGARFCLDEIKEETHFYKHQKAGADIIRVWMNEHKFSNDKIKYVTTLVYNHMHGYAETEPSKKSYLKLFAALDGAGITIEEYVIHLYGDNQGNHAKPRIKFGDFIKDNIYIKKYYEMKFTNEPFKIHDLEINGKDIIEKYGMKAGKELGALLKEMFDLVQEGTLRNVKPDLHFYVKTKINGIYGKRKIGVTT